jgi:hypothetical protein
MYLTRCPTCGERVATAEIGQVMACPKCLVRYPAEVNEADNTREAFVAHIRDHIAGAGVGLIITGILGIVCALIPLALLGSELATAREDIDILGVALNWVAVLACSMLSAALIYGGTQLMRARQYWLCVLFAVLAMLPFSGLCFPAGFVSGLAALYYLRKPEVRKAFALNRGEE